MERQSAGSVKSLTCLQLNAATGCRREGGWRVGPSLVTCPDPTHCAGNVGSFLHVRNNTNYRLRWVLKCWYSLGGSECNSVLIIEKKMMAQFQIQRNSLYSYWKCVALYVFGTRHISKCLNNDVFPEVMFEGKCLIVFQLQSRKLELTRTELKLLLFAQITILILSPLKNKEINPRGT